MKFHLLKRDINKTKLNKIAQISHKRIVELDKLIIDNIIKDNWIKVENLRYERSLWREVNSIIGRKSKNV